MTCSVIIVTLNRADCVRRCLECLEAQVPKPDQLIVVDASKDELTKNVVAEFPGVVYLRNDNGFGRMTASRNIGLAASTGEIIAFVDDDSFAHEGWLVNLLETYTLDPAIGAVGGRALNNNPNEATQGVDRIGVIHPNGILEGHFAADPGKVIPVQHIIGCNMSFRREVLTRLNGFRQDYPGISGIREDSDMCLRVGLAGYKLVFNPKAVVTHIGAPQAKGRRFDARYAYYHAHNHAILMIRNYGLKGITWRSGFRDFLDGLREFVSRLGVAFGHFFARLAGLIIGTLWGFSRYLIERSNPIRKG